MAAIGGIGVLFQPEGVDAHRGTTSGGGTSQHARTGGIVDVEVLVGGACIPVDEVVQQVVGQGRGGATGGAAGDVAPIIVAARVDLPTFAGAGRASGIHAGQPVRLAGAAATIEVLILGVPAVERSLPQLTEMGVDKSVAVAGSRKRIGEGGSATGAVACPWLGARVACPH